MAPPAARLYQLAYQRASAKCDGAQRRQDMPLRLRQPRQGGRGVLDAAPPAVRPWLASVQASLRDGGPASQGLLSGFASSPSQVRDADNRLRSSPIQATHAVPYD